jgi:hypothetical protein
VPADESLPGTLKRSPKKAQETWLKTHDSAMDQYGEGEGAKVELLERARELEIAGRSKMDKLELARAMGRKQR